MFRKAFRVQKTVYCQNVYKMVDAISFSTEIEINGKKKKVINKHCNVIALEILLKFFVDHSQFRGIKTECFVGMWNLLRFWL